MEETTLKNFSAYIYNKPNLNHLRNIALQGKAGELRLRTIAWKFFLGILPFTSNKAEWIHSIRRARTECTLHQESLDAFSKTGCQEAALSKDFPVDALPYLYDSELIREQIQKDVKRTNPEKN